MCSLSDFSTNSDAAERSHTTETTKTTETTETIERYVHIETDGAMRDPLSRARAMAASLSRDNAASMCANMELHTVVESLKAIRKSEIILSIEAGRKRKRGETDPDKFPVGHPMADEDWPRCEQYSESAREVLSDMADAIRVAVPQAFP
jgi:hypothetical protein